MRSSGYLARIALRELLAQLSQTDSRILHKEVNMVRQKAGVFGCKWCKLGRIDASRRVSVEPESCRSTGGSAESGVDASIQRLRTA